MSGFNKMITTAKGQNVISRLLAEEKSVKFSKLCTSSKIYLENEIDNLTILENIKQEIPIDSVAIENNSTIKISATINNLELLENYNICSLGIYIMVDNIEYLYSLASVDNEDASIFMPRKNESVITKFDLSFFTTISNADKIKFEVNATGFASKEDTYTKDEVYNKTEVYSKSETYTKNEIENKLETLSNNVSLNCYSLTLLVSNWVLNETTNMYEYDVTNVNITAKHYVTIDGDTINKQKFTGIGSVDSYNGGFKIEATELPESDIEITVVYQLSNLEVIEEVTEGVVENAG